jgi:hypothetical protein
MKNKISSLLALFLFLTLFFPSFLSAQVPAYVPTNGLVGYWPFNGNANDESGNGNNGTINGATLTSDRNGNANSAYSFDGVDNKIDANNTSNIAIASNSANSISIWFISNGDNYGRLLSFTSDIPGDMSYRVQLVHETNGNITFNGAQYSGLPNPPYVQVSCPNITLNTWNNIVVTHENSLVKIFLNSELINSNQYTGPIAPVAQSMNLHFGYIPNEPQERFAGTIDDIAIYNRALTPEEITALYNGATTIPGCTNSTACNYNATATQDDGSCTFPAQTYLNCAGTCLNDANSNGICDEVEANFPSYLPANGLVAWYSFNGNANDESGNGNNGTVNGATLTTDRNGNANSAYYFNGINNYIQVPFSNSLNSIQNGITMSAWVLMQGGTGASTPPRVLELRGAYGNGGDAGFVMLAQDNSNVSRTFEVRWHNDFGNNNISISPTNSINSLSWQHILFTADGSTATGKFYLNGIMINNNSSMPYQGIINSCDYNNNPLIIGAETNLLGMWGGKLDDIAIYNRALTPTEISALYNGTTDNNSGNNNNTSNTTVPAGISYQAVARNAQGTALANTAIQVKFTMITDSLSGTTEYVETHSLSTNSMGLFTTAFGTGAAVSGTWAGINWTHSNKYLKVELDAGNGYVDLGTQQLLSSPFAIRAQSAATIENGALPVFADNAAALAGGLTAGKLYRTATGELKVVY